ncbi:MAG: hypothetical protein WC246_01165 [Candidatus Paceibacterota bacterium]|jgi:hypothetical protein
MDTFSKDVITQIEKKHIAPRPRWIFIVRNAGTWIVSGLLIVVGAMVISAAWYSLFDNDWDVYSYGGANPFIFILQNIPYFWIAIALVLFGLVFLSFRQTREGYHYAAGAIVVGTIVISIVAGAMLFGIGAGEHVERLAYTYVPYYRGTEERHADVWMDPAHGLLAGTINHIDSTTQFTLTDLAGVRWTVIASGTQWQPDASLREGAVIKLVGTPATDTVIFVAKEIRPWSSSSEYRSPLPAKK